MSRRTTIKQVALEANVSVATISRALQNPEVVAPATLERVQAAIQKLGYFPNAQARNLRTERSWLIIALVPDIANPFFSEVIRGIERVAHANGYSVLLGDTEYDPAREERYAQLVATRQADGIVTLLPHTPTICRSGRLPIVNACEYVTDKAITSIYVDNVGGARAITDYLLLLGHRDIALINGRESPISSDRARGYRDALAARDIAPDERLIVSGDFGAESGVRAIETLLAGGAPFSAVFCSSDEMALGAIRGLRARGLRVPQDVSVAGFDDIQLARFFDPPLTTIAQPKSELGEEAMRMLLDLLNDPLTPVRKRMLPTELVIRGSTGAPRET